MAHRHSDGNSRALPTSARARVQTFPNCSACQGHLVADLYIDTVDAGGHVWIRALRCVRCRRIADADREAFQAQSNAGRIGRMLRELPEWGLNDEMTALGT
jgi:hypothetical protein